MLDDSSGADVCRASDLECVRIPSFPQHSSSESNMSTETRCRLLQSGNFADVKIVCGDRSWDCHIAILTSRSTWFRKALAGPFEVRRCATSSNPIDTDNCQIQEASTRKVELNEENPTCIDLALKYIYGGGE